MFSTNCVPFYSSEDIKCKGLEREWTQMYQVREVETALSVLRNHSLALSFVLAEKDESSSSHKPLGPRTGSRYCLLWLLFLLHFWPFLFNLSLPGSPNILFISPRVCLPFSSTLHFIAGCPLITGGYFALALHLTLRPVLRRRVLGVSKGRSVFARK